MSIAGTQHCCKNWFTCCQIVIALAAIIVSPYTASAQSSTGPATVEPRRWDVGLWTGEALGVPMGPSDANAQLTMAGFHLSRVIRESSRESFFAPTLEYVVEGQPLFLVTRPQTVYGGGFSPLGLRLDFARRDPWQPYLEWNGGGMFTRTDVPPGRTASFNFTTSVGPGLMIHVRQNKAISLGVRLWHLSNAGTGYTNPSFNTVQIVIGYHWLKPASLFR
jgi:Lipid A 3-O-deacylase (PagL)